MEKKPTLPIVLTIIGLVIQLCWIYLQISHWKQPNADYLSIAINIGVTLALWGILAYFLLRNWRERKPRVSPLQLEVVAQLWVQWSALADSYERLDYDNRTNNSTRFPFHRASWPGFGEPWSMVNAELYKYRFFATQLGEATEKAAKLLEWPDWAGIPTMGETTIMVEFIRECRELQAYLEHKRRSLNMN